MLEIEKLIKTNENWRDIISIDPYNINIIEDDKYILLKYKINAGFTIPLVREYRGIIFNKYTMKPVCIPFYKFGNYGESYVDDIDWKTAKVQEKIDGSLIKMWYDDKWHISTNSTIDASDANIQECIKYSNFKDLFLSCVDENKLYDVLDKNNTYMFELVSQYNQVVIKYNKTKIYHIGTRNNNTLQEMNIDIGIEKPKLYDIHTLQECINTASTMEYNHEGFVVVDANYHRIKIKNPIYVAMHHAVNNHVLTPNRILNIITIGEQEEFLNYFPEYLDIFKEMCYNINAIKREFEIIINKIQTQNFNTRKEFAEYAKSKPLTQFYFYIKDKEYNNSDDVWNDLSQNKKLELIKWIRNR